MDIFGLEVPVSIIVALGTIIFGFIISNLFLEDYEKLTQEIYHRKTITMVVTVIVFLLYMFLLIVFEHSLYEDTINETNCILKLLDPDDKINKIGKAHV